VALSSLPLFHRVAGQRVVVVGEGPTADAKRRLVERAGGACCGEPEAHHARVAFIAIEDRRMAEATALRLTAKGLLVNVADRPELCDFTLPSVLERGPVVVAVGTGGASAGLAKQLRLRLEALIPQSLGALAQGLFAARERLRTRYPDSSVRRRALDAALTAGGPLDPLREDSADRLGGWLEAGAASPAARTAEIVLTSPDPDDLTVREARLLGEADAVAHDGQVPDAILVRARADAVRRNLASGDPTDPGLTVIVRWAGSGDQAAPTA
jgi:uroporphyrin-III C-methyltransferase/precorrin-2 dehydrogenase/sirohydrochlorin ferrochelatase